MIRQRGARPDAALRELGGARAVFYLAAWVAQRTKQEPVAQRDGVPSKNSRALKKKNPAVGTPG
jgi:hypothetical protein